MYFVMAGKTPRWKADSISLEVMLTDSALALKWILSFLPFLFECALLEVGGAGNDWVTRSNVFCEESGWPFGTSFRSACRSPINWSEACGVIDQFLSALRVD